MNQLTITWDPADSPGEQIRQIEVVTSLLALAHRELPGVSSSIEHTLPGLEDDEPLDTLTRRRIPSPSL